MKELEFNKEEEYYDLETLITEGTDANIPIVIEFPNGKKAQAQIRPISTGEFSTIYNGDVSELVVNVLSIALMNKKGEPLDPKLIKALPIGLPVKIVEKIFEISGIETNPEDQEKLKKDLELFP